VELNGAPYSFAGLVGLKVYDQSGRSLGRVFEARACWREDGSLVIEELMVGRRALRRRLRGPGPEDRGIPWEAVVELSEERVVVRR
jgi:sporulation protein YlmC with PRC-barrel domain